MPANAYDGAGQSRLLGAKCNLRLAWSLARGGGNATSRGSIAKTTIRYQIAADNTRNLSILLSNECRDAKFPKARCFPVAPVANFFLFWNSNPVIFHEGN
jgi:hypothetical protein